MEFTKIRLSILISILCICVSCNKDNPIDDITDNKHQTENKTETEEKKESNPVPVKPVEQYYFELDRPAIREIRPDKGSLEIYIEGNSSYKIEVKGTVRGLVVNPTSGTVSGKGHVTVYYEEVKDKFSYHESSYIIFIAQEGPKDNYKTVKREFYIFRHAELKRI